MRLLLDLFWNFVEASRDSKWGHGLLIVLGVALAAYGCYSISGRHKKWAALGFILGSSIVVFIFRDIIHSASVMLQARM